MNLKTTIEAKTTWHGATTEQSMSHLAIWAFVDGSGGELMEQVSDAVYLGEAAADRSIARGMK